MFWSIKPSYMLTKIYSNFYPLYPFLNKLWLYPKGCTKRAQNCTGQRIYDNKLYVQRKYFNPALNIYMSSARHAQHIFHVCSTYWFTLMYSMYSYMEYSSLYPTTAAQSCIPCTLLIYMEYSSLSPSTVVKSCIPCTPIWSTEASLQLLL